MLRGQRSRVYDVGFGAAGDRVVSAGDDGTARIWDAGRHAGVAGAARDHNTDFSPDGRLISSGSDDGKVRVWAADAGEPSASLPGPPGYATGRYSPTTDEVVFASDGDSNVRVWAVAADETETSVAKGRGMNAARFDATGERIVYVDFKGKIGVVDLRPAARSCSRARREDVLDAQLSPDGEHVAAGTEKGVILVWSLDRPAEPERTLEAIADT